MSEVQAIIEKIHTVFGENAYPGDAYLLGSIEGCEPYDEVAPFQGKEDWKAIDAGFLDAHASALSFFSEAGFRFFLPAFLVADLQNKLSVADPLFSLTHGFSEVDVEVPTIDGVFLIRSGKSALVNPRRYGAATFFDYARYRLSVFTREEAAAIVLYLRYKRDSDGSGIEKDRIGAALDLFWLDRARAAPSSADLKREIARQAKYLAAIEGRGAEL